MILAGCESPGPANPLSPASEQAEVASVLESVAEGHRPAYILRKTGARGRWEDVEDALAWAIAEPGVEMGLRRTREFPWGLVFELETVEGWPATFTVRKAAPPRVFEAEAEVGLLAEFIPERAERARALERAFTDWMGTLGAKEKPVRVDQSDG